MQNRPDPLFSFANKISKNGISTKLIYILKICPLSLFVKMDNISSNQIPQKGQSRSV
jgi:hypothetical protein